MAPHDAPESLLLRATRVVEDAGALDALGDPLRAAVSGVLDRVPPVADLLHGRPLGHALHPLLTDVPIGLWTSASVLDLVGGERARPAADRLVGLGLLASLPTSLTGAADWARSGRRTRRVGTVHAVLNSTAWGLYAGSWLLRRAGRRGAGVTLGLAASGVVGAGGFLGGHMSYRLGAPPRGLSGPASERPVPDADKVDVTDAAVDAEVAAGHA